MLIKKPRLFHIAEVSGVRNDDEVCIRDGLEELLGNVDRAATIVIAPKNQRRNCDVRQQISRIHFRRRQRHQTEPNRVKVGDYGRKLFAELV